MNDITYSFTIPLEIIFTLCSVLSFILGVIIGALFLYRQVPAKPQEYEADEYPF